MLRRIWPNQQEKARARLPEGVVEIVEDALVPQRTLEEICNTFQARTEVTSEDLLDR